MTPNLFLRGGHWCPTCMTDPASYADVADVSPFFAQAYIEAVLAHPWMEEWYQAAQNEQWVIEKFETEPGK